MDDLVGSRGEAICYVLLTKHHAGRGAIFRPQFLGDKWPVVDFIVELVSVGSSIPFFFVQVRSTRAGYTPRTKQLRVKASSAQVTALASYPAPTYIVAIDEVTETGYKYQNRNTLSLETSVFVWTSSTDSVEAVSQMIIYFGFGTYRVG